MGRARAKETRDNRISEKGWGPYLIARHGDEDFLGGIADYKQQLYVAHLLWNGEDTGLKKGLFGLTGNPLFPGQFLFTAKRAYEI